MGKGTIASGGDKGKYRVTIDYGSDIASARITALTNRKEALEPQIAAAEQRVSDLEALQVTSLSQLNDAINIYNASEKESEDKEKLEERVVYPLSVESELKQGRSGLSMMNLEMANIDANLAGLTGLQLVETRDMWCADYTEDGSGQVSTIEINAEQPVIVIAPDAAGYDASYGEMTAREVQTAEQVYLNAALLPGWQKEMPTYRSGTITAINTGNDTCSVDLDDAKSSAQDLPINQVSSLSSVPIEYMTCHSNAFELGDKVVVRFPGQSWNSPKVVGFVSNPRPCGSDEVWFLVEVASRLESQGPGIGMRYAGDPVSRTVNYPTPGLAQWYDTWQDTWAKDVNINVGPTWDPGAETVHHDTLRVRFDVPWIKSFDSQSYFAPMSATQVDVTSHGPLYDMAPDTSPLGAAGTVTLSGLSAFITLPLWMDAQAGTAPWRYQNIEGDWIIVDDPEEPIWQGTEPTQSRYDLQAWSGLNWDNTANEDANDVDHASEWMLQFYDPPSSITLIYDEVEYIYEFVRMGGAPRSINLDQTVPPADPPSYPDQTSSYTTNGEYRTAVLYRRVGVV